MSVTTHPDEFRLDITQGAHFHLELPPCMDAETGAAFDFTADPEGGWSGRMEVRLSDDPTADPVAVFSTSPATGEGLITLAADGVPALDMDAADTGLLPAATEYTGASHAALVGDVALVDPADGEPWVFYRGRGQVSRQVTFIP